MHFTKLVSSGFAALLGLGLAAGARAQSAAPVDCTAPATAAACEAESYRKCPGKSDVCRDLLQQRFRAGFSASESQPLYPTGTDRELIDGAVKPKRYTAAKLLNAGGITGGYAAIESRALASAMSSAVTPAPTYVRSQTFLDNGDNTASCHEYVYEKYYDYMRFVDAANSCKADARCVVDMAYRSGVPGIANRVLRGRGNGGEALPAMPLSNGVVAKNPLHLGWMVLTPSFMSAMKARFPEHAARIDQLQKQLYGGSNYYRWGASTGTPETPTVANFSNEWQFHQVLGIVTAAIPAAESAARRRAAEEVELNVARAYEDLYCTVDPIACRNFPVLRKSNLETELGGDPWIRTAILGNSGLRSQALALSLSGQGFRLSPIENRIIAPNVMIFTPGTWQVATPITLPTVFNLVAPATTQGPVLGPVPVVTPTYTSNYAVAIDRIWQGRPPRFRAGAGMALECDTVGPLDADEFICRAAQGVVAELARELEGLPSCANPSYFGCDWTPEMFVARWKQNQHYMPERTRDYNDCMRWTSGSFQSSNPLLWSFPYVVPLAKQADVTTLEGFIEERRALYTDFEVPGRKQGDRFTGFGESRSATHEMGEKSTFGGGFAYDIGWSSDIYGRAPSGGICRMDFVAHGRFDAWAYMFDTKKSLLSAGLDLRVNDGDNRKASFQRHLTALEEYHLIPDEGPIEINHVSRSWTPHDEDRITIATGIFPVGGGVTLTLSAGAEISYGANISARADVLGDTGCFTTDALTATLGAEPWGNAGVFASAIGGWLGIVEVGLEVDIDLIKLKAPITATMGIGYGNFRELNLSFRLDGKLRAQTLSGSMDACGCFLVFCGCTEVASWPGIDLGTTELFTPVRATAPISLL